MHRLSPDEFINDSIIDFYLRFGAMHLAYVCVRTHCYSCRYLMRSEFKSRVDTFYVFSSFFYSKLLAERDDVEGKISASIHRWTRNEDIFRFKYLVVPINEKY